MNFQEETGPGQTFPGQGSTLDSCEGPTERPLLSCLVVHCAHPLQKINFFKFIDDSKNIHVIP